MMKFTANVSDQAMGKVSRLFNASMEDIFNELLQNARRAGATEIRVTTDPSFVTIQDDGPGISDPRVLFSLGQSGWHDKVIRSEDAAGMGFFSLATAETVTITAQKAGTDESWVIEANPDAFAGKSEITAQPGPKGHKGVTIRFPSNNILGDYYLKRCAEHFPLPIYLNEKLVEQENYLDGALHVEEWKGLRIGIFRGQTSPRVNFQGIKSYTRLPQVEQMYYHTHSVKVDVIDCPDLKLVLPARKEVVKDTFYDQLCEKIETLLFEQVAKQSDHSLKYIDWARAKKLGVDLPEATVILRNLDTGDYEKTTASAVLLDCDYRGSPLPPYYYEADARYSGYSGYDKYPLWEWEGYRIKAEGEDWEYIDPNGFPIGGVHRPDAIELVFDKGTVPIDYVVFGSHLDEATLFVVKEASPSAGDLEYYLEMTFNPHYDEHETLNQIVDEALYSEDDARLRQIQRIVDNELFHLLPRGKTLTVKGREVALS